jgi:hypothetical protein
MWLAVFQRNMLPLSSWYTDCTKKKMFPQFLKSYILAYMQIINNRTTNLKYFLRTSVLSYLAWLFKLIRTKGKSLCSTKFNVGLQYRVWTKSVTALVLFYLWKDGHKERNRLVRIGFLETLLKCVGGKFYFKNAISSSKTYFMCFSKIICYFCHVSPCPAAIIASCEI